MSKRMTALVLILALWLGAAAPWAAAQPGGSAAAEEIYLAADTAAFGQGTQRLEDYAGREGAVMRMEENGVLSWTFPAVAGRYTIRAEYYPEPGGSADIERRFTVNGATPDNLAAVRFPRRWVDVRQADGSFFTDAQGNQLTPRQQEAPAWLSLYLTDGTGLDSAPLYVDLQQGENRLAFAGNGGRLTLAGLRLIPDCSEPSYAQIEPDIGAPVSADVCVTLEAEQPAWKSHSSLTATSDRASASVSPCDPYVQKLNVIGGTRWKTPGEFLVWEVEAPQTGWYAISLKARKNSAPGFASYRRLYIDGEIPFAQCRALPFTYAVDWQTVTLGEGEQPYLFYLEKGPHTLKLEATVGDMAPILRDANASVLRLNALYRQFLVVIGAEPDVYRDYKLEEKTPELLQGLREEQGQIRSLYDRMRRIVPEKGSAFGTLDLMLDILERMTADPRNVPRYFTQFKTYLGSYATWLATAMGSPLQLDQLYIHGVQAPLPAAEVGLLQKAAHFFNSLVASYLVDYNAIGTFPGQAEGEDITVWMTGGRDQFQVLQSLLASGELQQQGVRADLKLVDGGILLKSILAGRAPDVMLSDAPSEIINYALRGAVAELNRFADLDTVLARFAPEAQVPLTLENRLYALPDTVSFQVLFYRRDILGELGLEVPRTWDDVTRQMSILGKSNLYFGIPATVDMYYSLLTQSGGRLYNRTGSAVAFDDAAGTDAFRKWTRYFTDYGQAYQFDFQNRFRTGEMPLGIAPYSFYSTLVVAAPEIAGLWDFALLPGTPTDGGGLDRTSTMTVTGSLILEDSPHKDAAWTFLKWWTSEETQTAYGTGVEAVLGASGRYAAANRAAIERLPWSLEQKAVLKAQMEQSRAIPEMPGGYLMTRGLNFAFRSVVVSRTQPKQTLLAYTKTINEELLAKRREFGLPLE